MDNNLCNCASSFLVVEIVVAAVVVVAAVGIAFAAAVVVVVDSLVMCLSTCRHRVAVNRLVLVYCRQCCLFGRTRVRRPGVLARPRIENDAADCHRSLIGRLAGGRRSSRLAGVCCRRHRY